MELLLGFTSFTRKNGLLMRLKMSPQAGLAVSGGDRVLISSFWFSESTQTMGGVTCRRLSLFLFFSQRDKKDEKGGLSLG
ncbi:hypothetical protein [Aeromonas salmonicida]|uniref:hypothetical protein n=1 Tax=Aeromonas salmonicida TaxID=645 RepID=UPI00283AB4E0|nr:hypothetical protein [Aeromonas salmonicida]